MTELRRDSDAGEPRPAHPPVPARAPSASDLAGPVDQTVIRADDTIAHAAQANQPAGPQRDAVDATLIRAPSELASSPSATAKPLPELPGLTLERELGRGGMGVVYLGKQSFLDRQVAVKVLSEQRQNAEFLARFRREAKILAGLQHAHIVTCYQSDVSADGLPYLVMEFVDGPNLRRWIEERGALHPDDATRLCRDLAGALGYASERKIIHRDVKAENVLLARDAHAAANAAFPWQPKLTDLGLARLETKDVNASSSFNLTVDAAVMGTPATMSPEQFDDPLSVDFRADIYGLGCVFYEALSGGPPFPQRTLSTLLLAKKEAVRGVDPRVRRPNVPGGAAELAMQMLAAERVDRPQSYAEIVQRCEELLASACAAPVLAAKRRWSPTWIAVALVVVIGAAAWFASRGGKHEDEAKLPQPAPTPTENKPTATLLVVADVPSSVREGATVVLDGSRTDSGGSHGSRYAWAQVSGEPRVELHDADEAKANFVAPNQRASYELAFSLTVVRGDERATSPPQTVRVEATDDAPVLAPTRHLNGAEGERMTLHARAEDLDGGEPVTYAWRQTKGVAVELADTNSSAPSFLPPNATAAYELEFEVAASSGTTAAQPQRVSVYVAAANDPPTVSIATSPTIDAGAPATLTADARDPEGSDELVYRWRQLENGAPSVKLEASDRPSVSFVAPEHAGDYDVELALDVGDAGLHAEIRATVHVASDPLLAPLPSGETRSWMAEIRGGAPVGWKAGGASDAFVPIPDQTQGALATAFDGSAWIVRNLPRGAFELRARMESQGKATRACGIRLVYAAEDAFNVCLVSTAEGDRRLVTYASKKDASGWSEPAAGERNVLGPWKASKPIELALAWDGAALSIRWRDPQLDAWSQVDPLALPARPRAVALFVAGGRMALFDVSIAGR